MPVLRSLLRFALGGALALVAVEGMVRQTWFRPGVQDPVFGYVPQPGVTVRWATEGDARSHWTEHGVRGTSLPPPGSRPILAVGDSYTEALMEDDAEVYTAQLEGRLAASGMHVPVVNVGRSGAGPADYVALAPAYARLFDPRWTVIQVREDDFGAEAWTGTQARFERNADGRLEASFHPQAPSRLARLVQPLGRWLAFPIYAGVRLHQFATGARAEPALFRGATAVEKPAAGQQDPVTEGYPVAEELERLHDAYGGRMTLLWLADYEPEGAPRPSPTESLAMTLCAQRGWSCVNLRDAFPEFRARYEAPYGFPNTRWNAGHLNPSGHRAAGALLAREMERLESRGLL